VLVSGWLVEHPQRLIGGTGKDYLVERDLLTAIDSEGDAHV
jgi:hypothetical protein